MLPWLAQTLSDFCKENPLVATGIGLTAAQAFARWAWLRCPTRLYRLTDELLEVHFTLKKKWVDHRRRLRGLQD